MLPPGKQGHVRKYCPARNAARALTRRDGQDGGDNGHVGKWYSFHRSTTHSEEECRFLQQRNQQTANFAQWSGYPPATGKREHFPPSPLTPWKHLERTIPKQITFGLSLPRTNPLLLLTAAASSAPSKGPTEKRPGVRDSGAELATYCGESARHFPHWCARWP